MREQIYSRALEPGSWIDEMKLSQEFGISRTPLREALKVLAVEGLVTMKLRRGAYVTEVSRDDVSQVYHLLALLESDAAAQVARTCRCRAARAAAAAACAAGEAGTPARRLLRDQRAVPHGAAGDRRQSLAPADRRRPAQGDEAQPPPLAVQAGPAGRLAGRTPRADGRHRRARRGQRATR